MGAGTDVTYKGELQADPTRVLQLQTDFDWLLPEIMAIISAEAVEGTTEASICSAAGQERRAVWAAGRATAPAAAKGVLRPPAH